MWFPNELRDRRAPCHLNQAVRWQLGDPRPMLPERGVHRFAGQLPVAQSLQFLLRSTRREERGPWQPLSPVPEKEGMPGRHARPDCHEVRVPAVDVQLRVREPAELVFVAIVIRDLVKVTQQRRSSPIVGWARPHRKKRCYAKEQIQPATPGMCPHKLTKRAVALEYPEFGVEVRGHVPSIRLATLDVEVVVNGQETTPFAMFRHAPAEQHPNFQGPPEL